MKIIALITEDFRLFYRAAKELKRRHIPFVSLSLDEIIPFNVGVVITTEEEGTKINFPKIVTISKGRDESEDPGVNNLSRAVDLAEQILRGRVKIKYLVIGIDPGMAPGIAVIGDGDLINQYKCYTPEEVAGVVKKIFSTYVAEDRKVKIGHQAVTFRNRILNNLMDLRREMDFVLEIVDETNTTQCKHNPDINAAIEISFMPGIPVDGPLDILLTEGEIKDIQRISRITSDSRVTISKELAIRVATGEIDLTEAIALQKEKKR